jgi:hypothetical protein
MNPTVSIYLHPMTRSVIPWSKIEIRNKICLLIAAAKASNIAEYITQLLQMDLAVSVRRITFDRSCITTIYYYVTDATPFYIAEIDRNVIKRGTDDVDILKAISSKDSVFRAQGA